MIEERLKGVNIYSFNYENYVSLQDYAKLQQRIDMAIEYINNNVDYQDVHKQVGINEFIDTTEDILDEKHIKELLSILKEERNDKK